MEQWSASGNVQDVFKVIPHAYTKIVYLRVRLLQNCVRIVRVFMSINVCISCVYVFMCICLCACACVCVCVNVHIIHYTLELVENIDNMIVYIYMYVPT